MRSKVGQLEILKQEGMKKRWKAHMFKVSGSTYLLYFKSGDVSVACSNLRSCIPLPYKRTKCKVSHCADIACNNNVMSTVGRVCAGWMLRGTGPEGL